MEHIEEICKYPLLEIMIHEQLVKFWPHYIAGGAREHVNNSTSSYVWEKPKAYQVETQAVR